MPEVEQADTMVIDEPGETDTPVKPARKAKAAEGMPKRVKIILEEQTEIPPTGLPLGHNGRTYVIVPGEVVDVPEFLLEILDHAVVSMPTVDPQTRRVVGYRDRMRFPYRRV